MRTRSHCSTYSSSLIFKIQVILLKTTSIPLLVILKYPRISFKNCKDCSGLWLVRYPVARRGQLYVSRSGNRETRKDTDDNWN
jgi:hypothetical protein